MASQNALAYAGLSLSGICLIWHLKTKTLSREDRGQQLGGFLPATIRGGLETRQAWRRNFGRAATFDS